MPDGELDVTGRLNKFSTTMVVSTLSASGRGHAPIIACFCWKRTKTSPQRSSSVRRRELAQKTPECRGKQLGGRPKSLDTEKRKMAGQLYREGNHTVQEICRLVGVSKPTLYSYVRQSA